MAKFKKKPKKRYARRFKKWRKSKPKPPFEMLIAAGTIPFTPAADGFGSMFECVQQGDFTGISDNLKCGFLGYDPQRFTSTWNLGAFLNPFDMNHGRFTKMLIFAGLVGMVRKKLVGRYTTPLFKKIPLIGRWVS